MSQPEQHPAVRDYGLVCMGALTVMVLALVLRRPDGWVLLPAFLGALGLIFRWRAAPLIVLLTVALVLWSWWLGTNPGRLVLFVGVWVPRWLLHGRLPHFDLGPSSHETLLQSDLLLAISLLTYAAAHYRVLGLTVRIFPADARLSRAAAKLAAKRQCRLPETVGRREVVTMLAALAACGGLAWLLWTWLRRQDTDFEITDPAWQGILALWLLGAGALAVGAVLRYVALRRMTPAEATLYLQDGLWRETPREQRRVNRWLAWANLLRRRREERKQS
jgi:hypothetical protein